MGFFFASVTEVFTSVYINVYKKNAFVWIKNLAKMYNMNKKHEK